MKPVRETRTVRFSRVINKTIFRKDYYRILKYNYTYLNIKLKLGVDLDLEVLMKIVIEKEVLCVFEVTGQYQYIALTTRPATSEISVECCHATIRRHSILILYVLDCLSCRIELNLE